MKIKSTNGKVTYATRVGKNTFVKSEMPLAQAKAIVNRAKESELTDNRGYGMEIAVDDTYFFPAIVTADKRNEENSEVQ